jgi:hypothetical protein
METLLVAILGGAGGAVLTTWLRNRHDREESFRDRKIAAADDFATAADEATSLSISRVFMATWRTAGLRSIVRLTRPSGKSTFSGLALPDYT